MAQQEYFGTDLAKPCKKTDTMLSVFFILPCIDKLFFMIIIQSMATEVIEKENIMEILLRARPRVYFKIGELVEVVVLAKQGVKLYVDLSGHSTGIVYGKEYLNARDLIKGLKVGDKVNVKIVDLENEDGFVDVSLKEAGSEMAWKETKELKKSQEPISLKVLEANKGGLVMEWRGIKGFLPASQLKASHYPKVEGGEKEKIFEELKKLVGQTLTVTILDFDSKENKLIFSEKGTESEELKRIVEKYKVGDVVEGEITGVVDFGVFIKIEEGLEGLAHISELDWGLVESPAAIFKVGEKTKAKIITVDGDKISLSVKALKPDPWEANKEKYKKGDIIEGRVARINKFGALVILPTGIYGLAHISEFGTEKKMRDALETGQIYVFQIVNYRPENKKMSFSFLGKPGEPYLNQPKTEEAKTEEVKKEEK